MCPLVGSHAPSCGRQLCGLPSRVGSLSPQGVLLPRVYGTIVPPLGIELRGPAAWQATPSWAECRHACQTLLPWLRVTFVMVPDAARPGSDQWPWSIAHATFPAGRLGSPSASDPWVWFVVPCPSAARGACARAVSGASWRLFNGVRALCVPCAVSMATWRLLTSVRAVCCMRLLLVASLPPSPLLVVVLLCFFSFGTPVLFFCFFVFLMLSCFCLSLFFLKKKKRKNAWATGAAVQQCCVPRRGVCCWWGAARRS